MKNIFFILLIVLLVIGCNKDNNVPSSILDGKIKTLDWYSPTNTLLASYTFVYNDSTGELIRVKNDTSDYLIFVDQGSNIIRMNYYETVIGIPSPKYKRIYLDDNNNITAIYDFDTITLNDEALNYRYRFNGNELDSIIEAFDPLPLSGILAPVDDKFIFTDNFIKFNSVWNMSDPPGYYTFYDTVSYTFTTLLNDGQIPMQFPLRTYKWNLNNDKDYPLGANMLYMLTQKGFCKKRNKNLIQTITISGSENYTINFEYILNSESQVIQMKMTDRQFGMPDVYTFKMTYY